MLEGRKITFKGEEDWYPCHIEEDGIAYDSPFPVVAITLDKEFLGFGKIIGAIGRQEDGTPMPVLELEDEEAPNGIVQILSGECYWVPMTEDRLDTALQGVAKLSVSAYRYAQELDAGHAAERN